MKITNEPITITDEEVEAMFAEMWHTYVVPTKRHPQPGDVAYCGHIKQRPHSERFRQLQPCPFCQAIKANP